MDKDLALRIAGAIIADLNGRRGLRHEWERIDDDIQEEIRETWAGIIERMAGDGLDR